MSAASDAQLLVPFEVDERERLNEWAAEIGIPVAELVRRLVLRYLDPPRARDAIDNRIGQTLLARATQMGHLPTDALRKALREPNPGDETDR